MTMFLLVNTRLFYDIVIPSVFVCGNNIGNKDMAEKHIHTETKGIEIGKIDRFRRAVE